MKMEYVTFSINGMKDRTVILAYRLELTKRTDAADSRDHYESPCVILLCSYVLHWTKKNTFIDKTL